MTEITNMEELVTSSSLSGEALSKQPRIFTISGWEARTYDDNPDKQVIVLSFTGTDQTLNLNNTRLKTVIGLFGKDPSALPGKQIMCSGRRLNGGKFDGQYTIDVSAPPTQDNGTGEVPF